MAGGYPTCCCPYGGPPDCGGCPDGTVEWFTHEVDGGEITRIDHEGPCYTYYVDSTSGDVTETGDGTEDDPWVNLNTVFSNDCIYNTCITENCHKVKVLVKGTVDYAITGNYGRNYQRNLIIEPWDAERLTVGMPSANTGFRDCVGCIWKNIDLEIEKLSVLSGPSGFQDCDVSTFDSCTITVLAGRGIVVGWSISDHCAFDSCTVHLVGTASQTVFGSNTGLTRLYAFLGSDHSTFKSCGATLLATGATDGSRTNPTAWAYGFDDCGVSTFDSCTVDATVTADRAENVIAAGFNNCASSSFDSCTVDATGNSSAGTDGAIQHTAKCFSGNSSSAFNACVGTATATVIDADDFVYSYGFLSNTSSTFDTCNGTATATGGTSFACGFDANTASSFINCTANPSGGACDI